MISIKWVTKFEADKLNVPNNIDYYLRDVRYNMLEHEYVFSGEAHRYGRGVPVVCQHGKPVAKWVVLPDQWAAFMVELLNPMYNNELRMIDFRTKASMPKCVTIKYPKE